MIAGASGRPRATTPRLLAAMGIAVALAVAIGAEAAPPSAGRPGASAPSPPGRDGRDAVTPARDAGHADVTPPALDDVEHMCALLTSCDGLPIPPSLVPRDFAGCVRTVMGELASPSAVAFSLTLKECGLRASSCSALRTCALRGAKPDVCAGRGKDSPAGFCDSDGRAISCWREKIFGVRDCPRGGEQCAVRDGEALCTLGPCPADMKDVGPSCSASGTRILRCEKGRIASLDCSAFGLRCATTADGPGCATVGAQCTGKALRCDGDVAVGCYNGREARVDCGAAGLGCAGGRATPYGACSPPDGDVGACETATRCDGANISYCFGRKQRSYFCKALGFARCVNDGKGARCAT